MNIYVNEEEFYSSKALERLKTIGNVKFQKNFKKIKKNFQNTHIIFVKLRDKIDEGFLNKFSNLKYIVCPTTSITHIDKNICKKRGIKVIKLDKSDLGLKSIYSTAELTMGLILSLRRNIHRSFYDSKVGKINSRYMYSGHSLNGQTIGIIGIGRIGMMVAKMSKSFNMKIIAYDKIKKKTLPKYIKITKSLQSIFKNSDIISLNISDLESNYNFINNKLIQLSKKKPLFINTSRGNFVDEKSLFKALKNGILSGIGLDVLKDEYSDKTINYLIKTHSDLNLLLTPHIGGCTFNEMKITEEIVVEKLLRKIRKNEI